MPGAVVASLVFAAPVAAAGLHVRTEPPMSPHFRSGVSDYVNRCVGHAKVTVEVDAPGGTRVSVDGGPARGGEFQVRRPLDSGQQLTFGVKRGGSHRTYHLRCLPSDFPTWKFKRKRRPSDAYYILTLGRLAAIWDAHGAPIWWTHTDGEKVFAQDAKMFGDDTIGWFPANSPYIGPPAFEIHRLDGSLVTTVGARVEPPSTDEHDIQRLPNGDFLLDTYRRGSGTVDMRTCGGPANAVVYDAEIQRVRPGQAAPVWTWNSKDHIALAETGRWCHQVGFIPLGDGTYAYDLIHLNALQLVHGSIVISTRHTDAAYKIAYPSGDIVWKLGGTHTSKSLDIVGDKYADTDFGGPHFARELPNGDFTIYDNGRGRHRASRALRFHIDLQKRTATLVDHVDDPTGRASGCCGSAEVRPSGNWLIGWGHKPLVSETRKDGATVFELTLQKYYYSYRVFPIPRGRVSREQFRRGMDAMNPR